MTTQSVLEWRGQELLDNDGQKIGTIEEIYLDTETDQPEWALVKTGLFGGKGTFVPLQQANPSEGGVQVPFEKSHVKDAPNVDPDGELSQSEEQTLYRHYGLEYGESQSGSGLPEGGAGRTGGTAGEGSFDDRPPVGDDVSGPETDNAMTRSEEELSVGKTERETGRARLRKYVVTDEVQ
jgi:sporulation protein YlmC with PRC-barrel domain